MELTPPFKKCENTRKTHLKEKVKPIRNHTREFPAIFVELILKLVLNRTFPYKYNKNKLITDCKDEIRQPEFYAGKSIKVQTPSISVF